MIHFQLHIGRSWPVIGENKLLYSDCKLIIGVSLSTLV